MESKPELRIPFEFRAPIETARLTIRGYRADDFDAFFSWRSRDDVTRYQDFDTQTREEAERSFSRAHERIHITNEGDGVVVALERREDARVIGDMVLFYDSALHDGAEIGWTLHPDYQGKGYATEAAQAMLRLAFETIGFHRVKANLDPRNAPSEALCRRLGMRLEAHHVEDFWCKGEWTDSYIFAILDREWRAMNP